MIHKAGGTFVVNCDECTEYLETDTDDFHDAIAYMKSEQWRVAKNADDEWVHFCPEHA
jgi:hypothetical protein